MSIKAIIGGVLAFVGGIAVGMLYAPASGAATRRKLVRAGRGIGDKAADAMESANELVDRAKRRIA